MNELEESKKRVRRSLMNRIKVYDSLMGDCESSAERQMLYKTQVKYLNRLELLCL